MMLTSHSLLRSYILHRHLQPRSRILPERIQRLNSRAHLSSWILGHILRLGQWSGAIEGLLTATDSATEFASGVNFWNQYGRLLYNSAVGQPHYNTSLLKGTKPILRTTSQPWISQSANYWTTGFFGFNSTDNYDLVIIPEGGMENNTLASYDSCPNFYNSSIYYMGDYVAVSTWNLWCDSAHSFWCWPIIDQLHSSLPQASHSTNL